MWGEDRVKLMRTPELQSGNGTDKRECFLFMATKKKKEAGASNKTSLLNRIQYAHTKKGDSYTGGKGGFSEAIHEKKKKESSPSLFLPRLQPSGLWQSMN